MQYFVYIMASRRNGTLYVGVTASLPRLAWAHCEGLVDGFTKQYGLKRLVWAEHHDDIRSVIQREKNIKHRPRAWKIDLIEAINLEWEDFYQQFVSLR